MDSFSLVSYLSPVRVSGPPEARDPNLMVLAALNPEKAPPAEIVSILNDILPPREFEEGGFKWRQVVSTKQVGRAEELELELELEPEKSRWVGTRLPSWGRVCQGSSCNCKLVGRESARREGSSIRKLLMSLSGRSVGPSHHNIW